MTPDAYVSTRKVGAAEVTLLLEGYGPYPVDLNVPEEVWRPEVPEADAAGNVVIATGGAYIRLGGASIVVDPGLDDPDSPAAPVVETVFQGWTFTPGMQAGLEQIGVQPEAVDYVLITHAHFDHCLGLTTLRGGAEAPRFPNARYLLDAADWAMHFGPDDTPHPLPPSPFVAVNDDMRRRLLHIRKAGLLDLVTGDVAVVPGLEFIPAPGESPGHRAVRLESDGAVFWHLGDIAHYAVEFSHLDWLAPRRRDPVAMEATRRAIFPRLVAEDALVAWSHAPFPSWGHVVADGEGYRWVGGR